MNHCTRCGRILAADPYQTNAFGWCGLCEVASRAPRTHLMPSLVPSLAPVPSLPYKGPYGEP